MISKAKLPLSERVYRGILLFFFALIPYIGFLVYRFQSSDVTMDHGHIYEKRDLAVIGVAFLVEHV